MILGQQEFAEAVLTLPGDLPRQVMNEFSRGWNMTAVMAETRQQQAAAQLGECHTVEGMGQKVLSIDADAFHYWGQRLGYDCWKDRKFRREFARDNPAARVRTVSRGNSVIVDGFRK